MQGGARSGPIEDPAGRSREPPGRVRMAGLRGRVRTGGAARSGPYGWMLDAGVSNLCAVGIGGMRPYRESTFMMNADMEVHP